MFILIDASDVFKELGRCILQVYLVVLLGILSMHFCGNKIDLQRPFSNMERTYYFGIG